MRSLPGAAQYIAGTKLITCKRCGCGQLAWAKSTRTGKSYLCHTAKSQSENALDLYVTAPWQPHSCDEYRARQEADRQAAQTAAAENRANTYAVVRTILTVTREARLAGRPANIIAGMLTAAANMRKMPAA